MMSSIQLIALMAEILEILESSTLLRQLKRYNTHLDEDFSENDDPYIDEDGNFFANEQIVSDIEDDLALDEEDRKVLEDLPTLVAATERVKAEDAQETVMVHQVLKSVSRAVRMIIGRVIVQR